MELTVGEHVDPQAQALGMAVGSSPLTVTARCDGALAGFASGWCAEHAAHLAVLVVAPTCEDLGVARHLVAAFTSEAARRGCELVTLAPDVRDRQDLE